MTEEKQDKINALAKTCGLLGRINRNNPLVRPSDIYYFGLLEKYFDRINNAREQGKFLASHTVFFPTEILYAMDIVPMHTEMTTWLIAMYLKEQAVILAAGTELGLATEICSPHRGLAGAFKSRYLPRPDVVLWSNLICDNTAKSGELLAEVNKCPGFFLDHPFQESEAESRYLINELKEMVAFLEKLSGNKLDWDKLSEITARTNRQMELFREINNLRKAVPSPFPTIGYLQLLSIDYLYPGQPEAITYLTMLRDEMAKMVQEGKGAVNPERFRLMTLFIPPVHQLTFLDRLSQKTGAISVVEPLFTLWPEGSLDPDRPLESVAKKADLIPERYMMYGPLKQKTLDEIRKIAIDYRVDGAIYWAFIGCRHTCATVKVIKDVLGEADIPVLTVDCDIVDATITTEDEVKSKLEQFYELLEDR